MRRIVLWVMSTLTMLVLLFSYHTSQGAGSSTVPSAIQQLNQTPSSARRLVGLVDVGEQRITARSGSAAPRAPLSTKTYTGDTVMTQYGRSRCRSR